MNRSSSSKDQQFMNIPKSADVNINGEVRDQDTFVLGDDDEEEEGAEFLSSGGAGRVSISSHLPLDESIVDPWREEPPPYVAATPTLNSTFLDRGPSPKPDNTRPYKYYINRNDTLQGLSLRFGIDVRTICPLF